MLGMLGMLGIQWVFGTHQIPTEYPLAMLGMLGMLVTNVYYVTYTHWVLIFKSPHFYIINYPTLPHFFNKNWRNTDFVPHNKKVLAGVFI